MGIMDASNLGLLVLAKDIIVVASFLLEKLINKLFRRCAHAQTFCNELKVLL